MAFTRSAGPVELGSISFGQATGSMAMTAGDVVIFVVRWFNETDNTFTISSISVQDNAAATLIGTPQRNTYNGQEAAIQLAYLIVTSGGAKSVTLTMSASGITGTITGVQYHTSAGSIAFDASAGLAGANTQPSASLTTVAANALVFGAVGVSVSAGQPTAGAGYTLITIDDTLAFEEAEENLDGGTAGARAVNFGTTGSGAWMLQAASFSAGAGGVKEQVVKLVNESGAALANLTGLQVYGWDSNVPSDVSSLTPVDYTATGTTDASGFLHFVRTNTTLPVGNVTFVLVTQSNGSVSQSPAPRAFFGPVVIQ